MMLFATNIVICAENHFFSICFLCYKNEIVAIVLAISFIAAVCNKANQITNHIGSTLATTCTFLNCGMARKLSMADWMLFLICVVSVLLNFIRILTK